MGPTDLEVWSNHFEYHAERPSEVGQAVSDFLMPAELRLIASSIATMQRGGHAMGPELLYATERFAQARRIPHLARIVELLIHEELRHASLLSAFMRTHWIPGTKSRWDCLVGGMPRGVVSLRRRFSLLIKAELIEIVYYRALESATDCQRLRHLCRIIVSDKLAHVGFESEFLAMRGVGRATPWRDIGRSAQQICFVAAAVAAWLTHRRVLERAGYRAGSFVDACLAQHDFYLKPTRHRPETLWQR